MIEYCLEEISRSSTDRESARNKIQQRIPLIVGCIPSRYVYFAWLKLLQLVLSLKEKSKKLMFIPFKSLILLIFFHRAKAAKVADILRKKMSALATNEEDEDDDKEEESEAVDKNENKIDSKKLTKREAAQEMFLQVINSSDFFRWRNFLTFTFLLE